MKMKASELRIGNLLIFSNMIQPDRIIAVDRRFFSSASIEEGSGDFEITPYYQPIELTPEILEKAGFKKVSHEEFSDSFVLNVSTEGIIKWEDDGSILINDRLDDSIGYATNCVCKYVHQLQNLIHALTGQELTINL